MFIKTRTSQPQQLSAVVAARNQSWSLWASLAIGLSLAGLASSQTPGTWSLAGNMSTVRGTPTAAVLSDGTVLAVGGASTTATDLYNPASNTWTTTGPMSTARTYQAGTILADGRVLVAGGQDANGVTLASAEIYNPGTKTWTMTGSMTTPRYLHSASLLSNGQVLVVGGWASTCCFSGGQPGAQYPLTSSELWNPATGKWTAAVSMAHPHANHTATVLSSGQVLVAGGENYGQGSILEVGTSAAAELYDPVGGTWTAVGSMTTSRDFAASVPLSDGRAFVAGGSAGGCCSGLNTAEAYDPATFAWTALPSMSTGRNGPAASAFASGNRVLVSGGYSCCSDPNPTRASTEYYDLTTQAWHLTGSLNQARAYHKSVTLLDGTVLAIGGGFSSAERYYPDSGASIVTIRISSNLAWFTSSVTGAGCSPGTYTSYPTLAINWQPGSSCQVAVSGSPGSVFTSWTDGSTANPRTFIAPKTATTYTVTFGQSPAPSSIQATGGTPQSATVNTAFTNRLIATVTTSNGSGISGVTVTFTAPATGASGTFAGGVTTATTNSSGVATSAAFTANATAGSFTVTASVSGVSKPASFALTNNAAAAQTAATLVPSSYVTTAGSTGGQAVASSIDLLDESGTASTWSKYVEFQGKYAGYQVYTLPATIAPSTVKSIQVKVNYQGPAPTGQTWTWQLYNWATATYVSVGTNAGVPDWGAWKLLTFTATGTLANYIRSTDGQIRIQLLSNNSSDAVDIDYEAVIIGN